MHTEKQKQTEREREREREKVKQKKTECERDALSMPCAGCLGTLGHQSLSGLAGSDL